VPEPLVAVAVAVGRRVAVAVGVSVGVAVRVAVAVDVNVAVAAVVVAVGRTVAVGVAVAVTVAVGVTGVPPPRGLSNDSAYVAPPNVTVQFEYIDVGSCWAIVIVTDPPGASVRYAGNVVRA
jgi:hypothetical protein